MVQKLKESTIAELSERVVEAARLPHGSSVCFTRKKTGRQVRSDFVVRRRHITPNTLPMPDGRDTVSSFLDSVASLVSTDLKARGIEMSFRAPNGEVIFGNTHISTVRDIPGLPTEDEPDPLDVFLQVVDNSGVALRLGDISLLYDELLDTLGEGLATRLKKCAVQVAIKHKKRKGR